LILNLAAKLQKIRVIHIIHAKKIVSLASPKALTLEKTKNFWIFARLFVPLQTK